MTEVGYAVEGWADEPVAERIIAKAGHQPQRILTAGGKPRLDPKIPGYNRSARHRCWLVMRDLDHDDGGTCIADLRRDLAGGKVSAGMALRFAVRTTESWLLADVQGFSQFFHVSATRIPPNPESLDNPKRALVDTCRRSRSPAIRAAVIPRQGSGRSVGPEYSATIREFVELAWDLDRAALACPSLARAVACVGRVGGRA